MAHLNIGIWGLLKVTAQEVHLLELLCFLETKGVLGRDKICSFHFGRQDLEQEMYNLSLVLFFCREAERKELKMAKLAS